MEWVTDLIEYIGKLFTNLFNKIHDFVISIFRSILEFISGVVNSLEMPDSFDTGLQGVVSAFPSDILYIMNSLNIAECLAVISAAALFRLLRRLLTLGIW